MKEEIYMNQKEIKVELLALGEERDVLRFKFDSGDLDVNLNSSSCQNELKNIFVKLLELVFSTDISLHFHHSDEYKRGMYIEVCEEYISDLNREIAQVKTKLTKELNWKRFAK